MAHDLGFIITVLKVTFPVDATVAYGEEHDLATLLNLGHGFAAVCFVDDVLAAMG